MLRVSDGIVPAAHVVCPFESIPAKFLTMLKNGLTAPMKTLGAAVER